MKFWLKTTPALLLLTVACSPLAPSISKFGLAKSDKSADQSHVVDVVAGADGLAAGERTAVSVVIPAGDYKNKWEEIRGSTPSQELTRTQTDTFAEDGLVLVPSQDKSIQGHEPDLADSSASIYLVVSGLSEAEMKELESGVRVAVSLDQSVKTRLAWKIRLHEASALTGDPALDTQSEKTRELLNAALEKMAIGFSN
ncbi:MAG: hypothetical protein HYW49_12165 [Deltaproteobacteria bacterium]|nr:hypothetical protein [Deltaproteobacteria bacterium]